MLSRTLTRACSAAGRPAFAAGGTKNRAVRSFALLACDSSDSDEDEVEEALTPPPPPTELLMLTVPMPMPLPPLLGALQRGDLLWGDMDCPIPYMAPRYTFTTKLDPVQEVAEEEAEAAPTRTTEADLWSQPWAANMTAICGNAVSTASMSNAEWADCMRWLFQNGWAIAYWDRKGFDAVPDNLPPRIWLGDVTLGADEKAVSAPKACTIPRFCQGGKRCKEGCQYYHGDTIPRVNKPCAFGAACGASDPTGQKRSLCIHMHPGETWAPGMVVWRPGKGPAAGPVEEATL